MYLPPVATLQSNRSVFSTLYNKNDVLTIREVLSESISDNKEIYSISVVKYTFLFIIVKIYVIPLEIFSGRIIK